MLHSILSKYILSPSPRTTSNMTSLHSSLPSPGRVTWRKDLSAIARDPSTQYLRVRHTVIRGSEITPKPSPHVVYRIDVVTESNNWFVSKRYSQFYSLHLKLHKKFGLSWDLLPKKLVSGNLDQKNITERKRALEHYLQKLINSDSNIAMCEDLLRFLDVYHHDVVYVTRSLSSFVFKHGDPILSSRKLFQLSPTEIYCIGKRLKLPVETSPIDVCDSSQDLGHLFSFIHQLHDLMVLPRPDIGHFGNVSFDLSVFKSLSHLVIRDIEISLMEGLQTLQGQILNLRCHKCLSSLDDILVDPVSIQQSSPSHPPPPPDADPWRVEMTTKLVQSKLVLQPWHFLEKLDLSHNKIASVSQTLHLLPSLHTLSLAHNLLSQLDLHILSFLSIKHLNVAHNTINMIYRSKSPLSSITSLNISHNQLQNMDSTDCLPNLSSLDFSHNLVHSLQEIDKMLQLSQLAEFCFSDNPISLQKNARISIAAKFYVSNKSILLDGNEISEKEKYRIMSNINKFGSNVQNWPNSVSHVSIPSMVVPYWPTDQACQHHHRSLSVSISNNLILEDPQNEVSWSHFSSPLGGADSPSISSSTLSTPIDFHESPHRLGEVSSPESSLSDAFVNTDTESYDPLSDIRDSITTLDTDISVPRVVLTPELLEMPTPEDELEVSHTPTASRDHTPTRKLSGVRVVPKHALVHALALLDSLPSEDTFSNESELTPRPTLTCYTSDSVIDVIHSLALSESTSQGSGTPDYTCTMQQVLLEDKISKAIDSLLESPESTHIHINIASNQENVDLNQLTPQEIAFVINEHVLTEI